MTLTRPTAPQSGPLSIRLVTLNVRYATSKPSAGEQLWAVRCPRLCAQLKFITAGHESAFVCLQEVLYTQLTDIQAHLGPSWNHIGVGREDGDKKGEFSPIFFRAGVWACERNKTYWLSDTPEVPSRGWDAALERIATMGRFRHKQSGTEAIVMATHMDHQGVTAREKSAKLILKLAHAWTDSASQQSPPPVFLGGDFNSTPDDRAYKALTRPGSGMKDISDLVPESARYGNHELTYTSFGEPNEVPKRIDFLFVQEAHNIQFLTFGILSNRFDDKVYLSDHRAVVADMEIPARK